MAILISGLSIILPAAEEVTAIPPAIRQASGHES